MKIGYIILAHQKPNQLSKLLKVLESNDVEIFLHVDKKVNITPFLAELGSNGKKINLLKRYKCFWGSFGLVKATLEGINAAIIANCDYIILLSGSDYPIKSKRNISIYLKENSGKSFFTFYKMPAAHWIPNKEINRIKKYYFHFRGKLFEFPIDKEINSLPRKVLDFFLSLFLPSERALPKNIIPYGGDQWFCITANMAKAVLKFFDDRPDVYKFLKHCLIPDEIFLQTAIFNSENKVLAKDVTNTSLTFSNWPNKNTPSPAILEVSDFEMLKNTDKLFARKFDHELNKELLKKINTQLLGIK